jgi:hypothetical protein
LGLCADDKDDDKCKKLLEAMQNLTEAERSSGSAEFKGLAQRARQLRRSSLPPQTRAGYLKQYEGRQKELQDAN